MIPRIGISLGDPGGIGPEITARALADIPRDMLAPVVYGQREVWDRALAVAGVSDPLPPGALVSCDDARLEELSYGATARGGLASWRYLETATAALKSGAVAGLCTAPLSKAAIQPHHPGFRGHTEYLQEALGAPRVVMLMASPRLRVALATTHVALSQVPSRLTVEGIVATARLTAQELQGRFGLAHPRLALLGLNPHAGEQGAFGDEEGRLIVPARDMLRAEGWGVDGPLPADGYFARCEQAGYDAVIAMYHDQGLIPFKMLAFHDGVNVTLGLPRPRTSPDHGTAYDIAGKGVADARSMGAALRLCAQLASNVAGR